MSAHFPILVVVIPLFVSFIVLLCSFTPYRWYEWYLSTAATCLSFLISLSLLFSVLQNGPISYRLGGWAPPWGIEYRIDYFSGFMLVIVALVVFVTCVYAGKSILGSGSLTRQVIGDEGAIQIFTLYLLLSAGLFGIIVTGDMFNLYVFLEVASLSAYALVGIGYKKRSIVAGFNYLILGSIGACLYLLSVGYLYIMTGTLNMADLAQRLPAIYESKVILVAFALLMVGLFIKMALFPLHAWLPDAHGLAPSVVSAILSGCVIEVAAYAMIRSMFTVFTPAFVFEVLPIAGVLSVVAMVAMIAGSTMALAQTDIKRMLACSSVGQMGYIILGVSIANHTGLTGALVHLFSHAIIKASLFLSVGSVIYQTHIYEISDLEGQGRRMPITFAVFTIGALGMVGVPLTTGFVTEWKLAVGALEAGKGFMVPVLLLSALLNAIYFGRVLEIVWFKKDDTPGPEHESETEKGYVTKAPLSLAIPPLILVSFSIIFGIAAFIPVSIAEKAAAMLLGG
jgi:multicomponent Na+:H+ antiporter subunit D